MGYINMAFIQKKQIIVSCLLCLLILMSSCAAPKGEGFAVYLTKDEVLPSQMEDFRHIEITDEPVFSVKDIISYDALTHEIKLTDAVYTRVIQLDIPMNGKSFLVCVDKTPLYWGAFWVHLSSLSFNGVTIIKPLTISETKVIKIDLGYPDASFYTGNDPRSSGAIVSSLDQSGKLINKR